MEIYQFKDFKELEEMTKTDKPIPKNLNVCEQGCYLSLRALYKEYRMNEIDPQKATLDKKQIRIQYANDVRDWTFWGGIFKQTIEDIAKTNEKRSELRKCKPEDRLRVALELIELYSGEDWSGLKMEEEKS